MVRKSDFLIGGRRHYTLEAGDLQLLRDGEPIKLAAGVIVNTDPDRCTHHLGDADMATLHRGDSIVLSDDVEVDLTTLSCENYGESPHAE